MSAIDGGTEAGLIQRASMHEALIIPNADPGRIWQNTGALFVAVALSRALRVAVFIVLARHLGLRDFGLLALIVAYVEIFRVIADFGIDIALVRHLVIRAEASRFIGSAIVLKGMLALASYALGIGVMLALRYPQPKFNFLALGLVGLFLSSASNLFTAPFQSALQVRRIAWTGAAAAGVYAALAVVGIEMGQGVLYFVLSGLSAELCGFSLAASVFRHHVAPRWGGWDRLRTLFRHALPIGLMTGIVISYGRVGLVLLERFRGQAEVGTYALGLRIIEMVLLFAGALAGSAYPAMARLLSQDDLPGLRVLYKNFCRHVTSGTTAMALFLVLIGPLLLRLVSTEFLGAARPLDLLAWASVFIFANQLSSALLLASGLGGWILAVAGWNLCLNLTLNVLLIPHFGALGVAVAVVATESVNTVVQSLMVWRRFRILPSPGLWLRAMGACSVIAVNLMHSIPGLVLTTLILYLALALWQRDVSVRWIQNAIGFPRDRRAAKGEVG